MPKVGHEPLSSSIESDYETTTNTPIEGCYKTSSYIYNNVFQPFFSSCPQKESIDHIASRQAWPIIAAQYRLLTNTRTRQTNRDLETKMVLIQSIVCTSGYKEREGVRL